MVELFLGGGKIIPDVIDKTSLNLFSYTFYGN